jgi:hypothetical protein
MPSTTRSLPNLLFVVTVVAPDGMPGAVEATKDPRASLIAVEASPSLVLVYPCFRVASSLKISLRTGG